MEYLGVQDSEDKAVTCASKRGGLVHLKCMRQALIVEAGLAVSGGNFLQLRLPRLLLPPQLLHPPLQHLSEQETSLSLTLQGCLTVKQA